MIKKKLLYLILILLNCIESLADTTKKIEYAKTNEELRAEYVLTNMQQDYTICYVFYKIGEEGIKKTGKNTDIAKGIEKSADSSLKSAFETGELLEMTIEEMKKKVNSQIKIQSKEIENDYSNSSLLLNKYGNMCKNLIQNQKQRIMFWEKKALIKFK
tara:strand:+ start:116 stop:589 length:474 start_codon:yes stop_codon:yes gene_type:complete